MIQYLCWLTTCLQIRPSYCNLQLKLKTNESNLKPFSNHKNVIKHIHIYEHTQSKNNLTINKNTELMRRVRRKDKDRWTETEN